MRIQVCKEVKGISKKKLKEIHIKKKQNEVLDFRTKG